MPAGIRTFDPFPAVVEIRGVESGIALASVSRSGSAVVYAYEHDLARPRRPATPRIVTPCPSGGAADAYGVN